MKRIKETTLDLYIYIGFVLLGIYILWQTSYMHQSSVLFPRVFSYTLLFLSFLLFIFNFPYRRYLLTRKTEEVRIKNKILNEKANVYYKFYPFLIIITSVFFILGFQYIGFDFSAFVTLLIIMLSINKKEALRKCYLAIFIPLAIVLFFKYILKLRLPLLIEKLF